MNLQFVMATLAATLLGCGSTLAQVGGTGTSPLGATSPLAMGSGSPVASTGIPLGATEMAAPGTSPAPLSTMNMLGCSDAAGSTSQTATPLFDGGGMAGAGSSACAATGSAGAGSAGSSMPTLSTLQAGRANIPLGSTEIGSAGLSPLPPILTMFVSPIVPSTAAPLSTMGSLPSTAAPPCPVTGTFPDGSTTRQVRMGSGGTTSAPGC